MEPNPTHGNNDLNRLESALLRVLSNKLQFFRPIGFLEEDFINKFLYSFLCKNSTLICRLTLPHQYQDLNKLASTQFRDILAYRFLYFVLKIPKNFINSESSPLKGGRGPYLKKLEFHSHTP